MSNYTKSTDFTAKDSLPSGDSQKVIRGSEFDTEFSAIATAVNSKADKSGDTVVLTAGTVSAPSLTTVGDTNTGIYFPAADKVAIATGGTQRVIVDDLGNVGVGTTPNAATTTTLFFGGVGAITAGNNSSLMFGNAYIDGVNSRYRTSKYATQYEQDNLNGRHYWYTAPSGTAGDIVTFTNRMTLDSSGNLGIGTSSPAYKLDTDGGPVRFTRSSKYLLINPNYNAANTNVDFETNVGMAFTFTQGTTERLRLDSSGNLGIGTSSPSTKLHVNTGAAGYGITVAANTQTANTYQIGIDGNSSLSFYDTTAAAQRLVLSNSGNLGLGVTPSAWQTGSNVVGIDIGTRAAISASNTRTSVWNNAYRGAGAVSIYKANGASSYYDQDDGVHAWFTAPSGTAGNAITFTQAMTLDASGNLGIGTSAPGSKLHLKDGGVVIKLETTGAIGSGSAAYINFDDSVGDSGYVGFGGTANRFDISNRKNGAMTFSTNNTERARITSGGDFLVGVTAGSAKFDVRQTTNVTGGFVYKSDTGNAAAFATRHDGASGATSRNQIEFGASGGTVVGTISSTGSATAYNTSSDYRLKNNPQPLTGSGAFIDSLQPKTWTWKADGTRGVGFIAHEVKAVSPNTVVGEKDAVDEEGNAIMQGMEYGSAEFIANIIAELQSLRARVATLENN